MEKAILWPDPVLLDLLPGLSSFDVYSVNSMVKSFSSFAKIVADRASETFLKL